MNVARWVGFLGAGVVLSSCGGYSSLGELPAAGGENDGDAMGGSQSMGAKGGRQGTGGTGMGTGGTNMGTGGTGMDATGGTGMGAYAGTGMGTGGGPDMTVPCMTVADCPSAPPVCPLCPDGTSACLVPTCSDSICGFDQPRCPIGPDAPYECIVDADCPNGHSCDMCADGSVVCAEALCITGTCAIVPPACPEAPCSHRGCGEPCMAPDGVSGWCDETSACVTRPFTSGSCDTPDMCRSGDECLWDAVCLLCSDGACAAGGCIDGQCGSVCKADFACMTPMDCPKTLSDDPCTTGPWLCVGGSCARAYQDCMVPQQ